MKRVVLVVLVLLLSVSALCAASYQNIMSPAAKGLVDKKKNVYLLDVRTPDEFRQARLKGAVLIPINEIEKRYKEIPKNRPVVIYCAVGTRSNLVAGFLVSKGYADVYNVVDGIVGWYRNGFPIER
jgi:rhodanese-related sulfurtransferase